MYQAKLPDENVNIPTSHPLIGLVKYIFIMGAFLIVLYFILILSIDFMASNITPIQERKIAKALSFDTMGDSKKSPYLESVSKKINKCAKLPYDVNIRYIKQKEPNAFAVIGGTIYVTSGLLDILDSENELAFVVGHEVGHFKNKDHLKQMSYGFILSIISSIISNGDDYSMQSLFGFAQSKYSQKAEFNADETGLELLVCSYGNASDASKLFKKMDKDSSDWKYFGSSHPSFKDRIKSIENSIKENHYDVSTKPLPLKKI